MEIKLMLICVFVVTIFSACSMRVTIDENFDVHYNDIDYGYHFYYKKEGIFRDRFCYGVGWNDSLILVKSKAINQRNNTDFSEESFTYYIINRNKFKGIIDSSISGPLTYVKIDSLKRSQQLPVELTIAKRFDKDPFLMVN